MAIPVGCCCCSFVCVALIAFAAGTGGAAVALGGGLGVESEDLVVSVGHLLEADLGHVVALEGENHGVFSVFRDDLGIPGGSRCGHVGIAGNVQHRVGAIIVGALVIAVAQAIEALGEVIGHEGYHGVVVLAVSRLIKGIGFGLHGVDLVLGQPFRHRRCGTGRRRRRCGGTGAGSRGGGGRCHRLLLVLLHPPEISPAATHCQNQQDDDDNISLFHSSLVFLPYE